MLCAFIVSSNLKNSSTRFLSTLIGSEFSYSPVFGKIAKMRSNILQSSPSPYFHFTAINIFILQRFLHAIYYLHRCANKQQIVFICYYCYYSQLPLKIWQLRHIRTAYDHEFQGTDLNETVFIVRNHFGHEELSFRNMQRSGTKLFKTFRDQHMKRHS